MKRLAVLSFVFISLSAFGQDTLWIGPKFPYDVKKWKITAGADIPMWFLRYKPDMENSNPFYGQNLHFLFGFNAEVECAVYKRQNAAKTKRSGVILSPLRFNYLYYDMEAQGGYKIESKTIHPLLEFSASVAPFFQFSRHHKIYFSFYFPFSIGYSRFSGEVKYVRTNFQAPVNNPVYSGNDRYYSSSASEYKGWDLGFSPGINFEWGRWSVGAEAQFVYSPGDVESVVFIGDYYNNPSASNPAISYVNENCFFGWTKVYMNITLGKYGRNTGQE